MHRHTKSWFKKIDNIIIDYGNQLSIYIVAISYTKEIKIILFSNTNLNHSTNLPAIIY